MNNITKVLENPNSLKVLLKTALQTAEMLGVSKQRLGAIKKKGHLQPVYSSTQGDLYLLSDIYYYKNGLQATGVNYYTKYMVYDLLLRKKKILVVGTVGQGKTYLVRKIKEELSEYMENILLYDSEWDYSCTDMHNDLINQNTGVIVTTQGLNAFEGYNNFISIMNEEKISLSLPQIPKFDVIIEVERGRGYKVIQIDDYFKDIYREMTS
ncbi:hypothetical protein FOL75_04905 [Bacillus thuringiensis]|uniref:hypothetical protein n=1 Tax=Bacillus thuringiensis TaxID=1428 RepID=UPI0028538804|nr:hypothetical protein [Bacillus thuringiensis]MDR5021408.1 hypothetical protein [Bacillus thuringiensis]